MNEAMIMIENKMLYLKLQDVERHCLCYDVMGKSLEACLVFEHCIKCIKKYLYKMIEVTLPDQLHSLDIGYIITVPAACGDNAKMLMREAAENVRIFKQQNV